MFIREESLELYQTFWKVFAKIVLQDPILSHEDKKALSPFYHKNNFDGK